MGFKVECDFHCFVQYIYIYIEEAKEDEGSYERDEKVV